MPKIEITKKIKVSDTNQIERLEKFKLIPKSSVIKYKLKNE